MAKIYQNLMELIGHTPLMEVQQITKNKGLKKHNPNLKAVAVEPDKSPVISGGEAEPHGIQGIGANFIPKNFHPSVVDEIIRVTEEDAMRTSRLMTKHEGLLVGISAGAALHAAILLGKQEENAVSCTEIG